MAGPLIVGPRIVGGSTYTIQQVPYQARLYRNGYFRCGASVLGAKWIITAAHCVDTVSQPSELIVGVNSAQLLSGGDYVSVKAVTVHPDWDPGQIRHDIAILELSSSVSATPVTLAGPDHASVWEPGDDLLVTGWGATSEGGGPSSNLLGAVVPRIADATCALLEDGSEPDSLAFDAHSQLCAGEIGGGVDACQGDSGGPLVSTEGSGPVLVGIVSWGTGCARPDHPGIYTRVETYRPWVEAVTGTCGLPSCYPIPPLGFALGGTNISGSYQPIPGDFNGDESWDIFWYRPGGGTDFIWFGDETRSFTSLATQVTGTYVPVSGDFNGDGFWDIFWYRPGGGADYVWWGSESDGFSSTKTSVTGTYEPISGDFNGDGFWDIFWYRPGGGADYVWWGSESDGFSSTKTSVTGTYEPFTVLLNDDARSDIVWHSPGGADYIWYATGSAGFSSVPVDISGGFMGVAGDFDASGGDDVVWYQPGSGRDTIWWSE